MKRGFKAIFLESLMKDGLPASAFLVVGDPKTPDTWHLPVRDANGKPSHSHMGAAFSALHGGYRGNKYEGPGKAEALNKLKAMYKAEKMPMPMSESLSLDESEILEALGSDGEKGSTWDVTIIASGKSKNIHNINGVKGPFFYSTEALSGSVPLFEGAQVYAHKDTPHKSAPNTKTVHDEVGWMSNVQMLGEKMRAHFNILPSASWLKENLLAAFSKNKKDIYQLSIHAGGAAYPKTVGGESVFYVESIDRVESVDVVPKGAAGGGFNSLLESFQTGVTDMKNKLLALFLLAYPTFLESQKVDVMKIDENELFTHLMEADKPQPRLMIPDGVKLEETWLDEKIKLFREAIFNPKAPDPPAKKADDRKSNVELEEGLKKLDAQNAEIEKRFCKITLLERLESSKLPVPLKESVRRVFDGKVFTEKELDAHIKDVRETYSKFLQADKRLVFAEAGQDQFDKVKFGVEAFFMAGSIAYQKGKYTAEQLKTDHKGIPPFRSFKEAYIMLTGDSTISGTRDSMRFSESMATGDMPKIVADAINKRLVWDYSMLDLNTWSAFVQTVPLGDFKTQHRIRFGGYPNLPTVAQGAAYGPLSSPTDEEATYVPTKYGGTEDLTREMIKNDDVGAIQRIPTRMARAAAQTLHEFVYNFITPAVNAAIYDTVVLYHATNPTAQPHANTGTAALASDGVALAAARLRMAKQAMKNNLKRLNIRPRFLLVPPDLAQVAYSLITPAFNLANQVPTYLQQLGIMPIQVAYWTDVTDWVLVGDPADCVGLEVGFVDGQETPLLFVSDLPNVGSWFTNDKLTYKIKHEYGAAVVDYRPFDGSVVAG